MPATNHAFTEENVRTRAYLLWEAGGRAHGRDDHYWCEAVAQLEAESIQPSLSSSAESEVVAVEKPRRCRTRARAQRRRLQRIPPRRTTKRRPKSARKAARRPQRKPLVKHLKPSLSPRLQRRNRRLPGKGVRSAKAERRRLYPHDRRSVARQRPRSRRSRRSVPPNRRSISSAVERYARSLLSTEVPAHRREAAQQMRHVDEALSDEVADLSFALPCAIHGKQRGT